MRDGVNIHTQSKREAIVPESEIMNLPDLKGFLKLPGAMPIAPFVLNIPKKNTDKE